MRPPGANEGDPLMTRRAVVRGALAATAAALVRPRAAPAALRAGDTPQSVTLPALDGSPVKLPDEYKGKIVVVHFWASWCSYCIKEIDALEALFGQHREHGLVPVSVNVGETQAAASSFLRGRNVTYPILLDPSSSTARRYGVTGIPTTFILDRDGAIRFKILGEINRESLRRILSGLL
jgi:peroxiredoxin